MMGAHVLRSGVQRYLIDLMERGLVSCLSMNGAGVVHDFEFALIGATTESVADYIRTGQFGLWRETGRINDIVTAGLESPSPSMLGLATTLFTNCPIAMERPTVPPATQIFSALLPSSNRCTGASL